MSLDFDRQGTTRAGDPTYDEFSRAMTERCSTCEMQFSDAAENKKPVSFTSEALAVFLVERIDALGADLQWQSEVDVNAVVHGYPSERAVGDRHLAKAMELLAGIPGVGKPDRFSEYWRLSDAEKVKEASRPNWESWDIAEEDALRFAHVYVVPSYGTNTTECPCNRARTRTGASWLKLHARIEAWR
jgi:hypothetical protein